MNRAEETLMELNFSSRPNIDGFLTYLVCVKINFIIFC